MNSLEIAEMNRLIADAESRAAAAQDKVDAIKEFIKSLRSESANTGVGRFIADEIERRLNEA